MDCAEPYVQERLAERITHSDGAANSGSFRASTAIRVARCYNSTLRLTAIPRTAPRFSSCTSRRSSVWRNSLSSPPTCAKDTSPRYSSRRPRRQKNSTKATAAKGNRMAITAASDIHRSPRVLTLEESRATNHARTISKLDPALQTLFISSPRCCICHWRGPQPPRPVLSL